MGELLLRKLVQCRDRIARIRRALPTSPEAIQEDEHLESHLLFQLFLLAQDAVDLAAHAVSERGLAIPSSQRETFLALAQAGILRPETAAAMAAIAGLRNRIAHTYGEVDTIRVVREIPAGLIAVEAFLAEMARALEAT